MQIMGIVNTSPDSFSDAVRLTTAEQQIAHARVLVACGAGIIDVGGESGVTYTEHTPVSEEIERVVPVIAALSEDGVTVSIDTFKPAVAEAALSAGATILNDVSALHDPELADVAAAHGATLVITHTRAAPKQRSFPEVGDIVADVEELLVEKIALARDRGVEHIVVDPGPDFTKTPAQTIEVLRAIERVRALQLPWLAAVSRKYFIGAITGREPHERLAGTLAAVGWAADHGAAIVRVHDVGEVHDYLAVRATLSGHAEVPEFDSEDERLMWIRHDR
ncbi:MAG TPA: dihydropteroate synthase [Baekduia sp.]|nr:dihydropteroate synthase [Baekduia sp.]